MHLRRLLAEGRVFRPDERHAGGSHPDLEPPVRAMTAGAGVQVSPVLYEGERGMGSVTRLAKGGRVIGLFDGGEYEQETIQMQSGDVLVAFTDGITEALNSSGEEFGESRLRNVVQAAASFSAREMTEEVVKSVKEWSGSRLQHDDLTLVIMKVK